ncbi:MAG: hypothetical protein JW384_03051 [Nitrosomonadaceae bacterium]|nr:hypothetical protein [Nitrosomonadaceae bacterium]
MESKFLTVEEVVEKSGLSRWSVEEYQRLQLIAVHHRGLNAEKNPRIPKRLYRRVRYYLPSVLADIRLAQAERRGVPAVAVRAYWRKWRKARAATTDK